MSHLPLIDTLSDTSMAATDQDDMLVDADEAALAWFRRMLDAVADAGDGRDELLADLGDAADQAALLRLARHLRPLDADAPQLIDAMRDAARDRRRSPARSRSASRRSARPRSTSMIRSKATASRIRARRGSCSSCSMCRPR